MSPEKFRKLAYTELEISTVNIILVMKWGNEQTDRHTIKYVIILKYFTKIPETSIENLKKIAPLELDIIISVRK